jgi:hypothetical protein
MTGRASKENRMNYDSTTHAITAAIDKKKTVMTKHKDYEGMSKKWLRSRDAAAGVDAIHQRSLNYLPKLNEQEDAAYQGYLKRACFYNATWRTISGLSGMMFRKPAQIECAESLKPLFDDITLANEPLHVFAQQLAIEVFTVGRAGVLVDYPTQDQQLAITRAQAEALNLRPTMQRYPAESIINWKTGLVANVTRLMLVVLTEETAIPVDEFSIKCETRYRVLDLVGDPANPSLMAYRVRVFRINEKTDSQEQVGTDFYPSMNGKPLVEIPFTFFGIDSVTPKVDVPPLIDLVDLNLAHFRVSADYEHGCHFTGLPTPVVSGYQPTVEGEKLYVGSTVAWVFPDSAAHASYLEFSGAGLGALQANLAHKEEQMAALGARLLTIDSAPGRETATTAAIHHSGETAVLAAVAQVESLGMTRALNIFSKWAGFDEEVKFELSRDFFPMAMDAGTLAALVAAWQAGAISAETLFENLQAGEIIDEERSFEDEQAKIANAAPTIASTDFATQQADAAHAKATELQANAADTAATAADTAAAHDAKAAATASKGAKK